MGEECEVQEFKYFQNQPRNWITDFTSFHNNIPTAIYRQFLDIKSNFDTAISELQDNNGASLKDTIQKINDLTKIYLKEFNDRFNIEIPNEMINGCIQISNKIGEKTEELKKLPGGDKAVEIQDVEQKIIQLQKDLKALIDSNDENNILEKQQIDDLNRVIENLKTQIDNLNGEITRLHISLLDLKAKKNLQDIKIKHHTKLLESYESTYNKEQEKMKKDIEELEKKIENNNKELEMLSDDKIKEKVRQEFKAKTISDATGSNDSAQEKETRKSVVVDNPYFDNSIINGKFPVPPEYKMTEEILYNGNDNFRNIGRLLLDKDKNALTSKESKLFSMKENGFDSVVTINMNNINNELEKYE